MYKNFDEVVAAVKQREIERTVAIAGAHDAPVVEAALRACLLYTSPSPRDTR